MNKNLLIIILVFMFAGTTTWLWPNTPKAEGGAFGTSSCTASTTVWTIGLDAQAGTKTVLPARSNRASFSITPIGANTTSYYRLDTTTPTQLNSIPLTASTTVSYLENFPYKGAVIANALATTSLVAVECIYQ